MAGHVVPLPPDEPRPQPILRGQQDRREQQQERDDSAERLLVGREQQDATDDAADHADRHGDPQPAALTAERLALSERRAKEPGTERDGVRDVGRERPARRPPSAPET